MKLEERIEFAFPNLRPKRQQLLKQPYAYVLTTRQEDKYLRTYPTLWHMAIHFGISSHREVPEDYLIRAIWADNRAYFVPNDLIFGEDGSVLLEEQIPKHFLERNLECYLVQHFWRNEELKAKGLPEQRSAVPDSAFNYKHPPECIPKIGWVDENHPMHSVRKGGCTR